MSILKNRVFLGLLAIAMAIVVGFVMVPVISNATSATIEVVRAKGDISIGETLTADNTEVVEVGRMNLPDGVACIQSEVIGLYASADFQAGDFITSRKVTERLVLPENKIRTMKSGESYVAIPLNGESNFVRLLPNDIVTVYGVNEDGNYEVVPELRYVSVVTTTTSDGTDILYASQKAPDGKRLNAASITFILTQQQAIKMLSVKNPRIMLTYRGNNDTIRNRYLNMQSAGVAVEDTATSTTAKDAATAATVTASK